MQCTAFHSEGARAISASMMNCSRRARAVNAFTPVHREKARAVNDFTMGHYMKVRATNAFEVLLEHIYSQWLDHLIIWALLKDAPIQKKAGNVPLRDQKRTTVHCPMHQPKQPTMRQNTSCKAATADWQLVTVIRRTIPKWVRWTWTCPQMPQKPLATGANATLIPLNKRHWGQPMPDHLEAKEKVVETKVSARPVTTVTKVPTQKTKPQTSTQQVHTIFQKVKQRREQEQQLAWQKAKQQSENTPTKKKTPEITMEAPHQTTEGEAPKQVCIQKPEENWRPPLSHPFSDDVVYLKWEMSDIGKPANPKPEISKEEQYKAFIPTLH